MHRGLLAILLLLGSSIPAARADEAPTRIEVSFGSALLFAEQPLLSDDPCLQEQRMLPVPSVLILFEYFIGPTITLGSMFNIPTSTRRRLVDGEIIEDHAAMTIALGPTHRPIEHPIFEERAALGIQYGLLGGRTINSTRGDQFFPLVFVRPSISTPDGFSMYLGLAFAFHTDTLGLLYGVGQRF
jgi:hypothetical protein